MKQIFSFLACGVLLFASCKKESDQAYGICGTGLYEDTPFEYTPDSPDSTLNPPDNPDTAAQVAVIRESNGTVRHIYYKENGLVDFITSTGTNPYNQRFTHTEAYSLSRFYDSGNNYTGHTDSILLNADGAPSAFYELQNGKVQAISFYTYNTQGYLIVHQYNDVAKGTTENFYYIWSGGNLMEVKENTNSKSVPTYYSYHILKGSAPGEPQQLEALFKWGRQIKHSLDLRITERKETESNPVPFQYRWREGRITEWMQGGTRAAATLIYYN